MKYALLADIHGNAWALEAVIADARARGVSRFVNLGDTYYGPLDPNKTWELLTTISVITIRGNQDRDLLTRIKDPSAFSHAKNIVTDVRAEILDEISALPATRGIAPDIFACHGTPASDTKYFIEDVSTGLPLVRPEAELCHELEGISARVILCGHSHLPRRLQLSDGRMIVNPGSVGLQAYEDDLPVRHLMQTGSPDASYAVLEAKAGEVNIFLIRVPYAAQDAAACAARHGRTDWEKALLTGIAGSDS